MIKLESPATGKRINVPRLARAIANSAPATRAWKRRPLLMYLTKKNIPHTEAANSGISPVALGAQKKTDGVTVAVSAATNLYFFVTSKLRAPIPREITINPTIWIPIQIGSGRE